jgi:hypothetical protein
MGPKTLVTKYQISAINSCCEKCDEKCAYMFNVYKDASSPKPLGQLEPNLAGMFLGWSSTKYLFFVPVGYSTWLPGPIICSDWLKFQRSSSLTQVSFIGGIWSTRRKPSTCHKLLTNLIT